MDFGHPLQTQEELVMDWTRHNQVNERQEYEKVVPVLESL